MKVQFYNVLFTNKIRFCLCKLLLLDYIFLSVQLRIYMQFSKIEAASIF